MNMDPDVIFAAIVGVLAALAVIGALAFVVVWEWCAIRRTLAAHRPPPIPPLPPTPLKRPASPDDFWRGRAVHIPAERRP
jgi:hypothetical protein